MTVERSVSKSRIVGIAFVVEHEDGTQTLYGSRQVDSLEFTVRSRIDPAESNAWRHGRFAMTTPPGPEIELSATMSDLTICMSREERVGGPLPLRGIYLPGMVFKALPGPSGGRL